MSVLSTMPLISAICDPSTTSVTSLTPAASVTSPLSPVTREDLCGVQVYEGQSQARGEAGTQLRQSKQHLEERRRLLVVEGLRQIETEGKDGSRWIEKKSYTAVSQLKQ